MGTNCRLCLRSRRGGAERVQLVVYSAPLDGKKPVLRRLISSVILRPKNRARRGCAPPSSDFTAHKINGDLIALRNGTGTRVCSLIRMAVHV